MSTSSFIYNARRFGYPLTQKLQQLIGKFNEKITEDVNDEGGEELQTRTEGGIGRSYLKFCDTQLSRLDNTITSTVVSTLHSCPAFEPDHAFCKMLIEFDNVGGYIPDRSNFEHHAKMWGTPRIRYGMRYSYGSLSLEAVFDGRTNWATVFDHPDISIDACDFSLLFRFAPYDLSMSSVHKQVVVSKREQDGSWLAFEIGADGSATFNLYKGTTHKTYSVAIPAGTITATAYQDVTPTTPRYDVVITHQYLADTVIVYINNTAYSTFSTTIPSNSSVPNYTGFDWMIGRYSTLVGRPVTLPQTDEIDSFRLFSKLYFGTFQQLEFWKNKILTATEVGYHYTNKLSIVNCAFGEIGIPGGVLILTT